MSTNIHRQLDDAFAGVPMTPETQDLKEEIRASLSARVAELQATGMDDAAAATKAIDELGDIHEAIESLGHGERPSSSAPRETAAAAYLRNRVRPRPRFVVRTVLLSLVLAAGIALVILVALQVVAWSLAGLAAVAVGVPVGILVFDGTRQETSQNYPLPPSRALGYGLAALAGALGLSLVGFFFGNTAALWLLIAGILLALASLVAMIWLGVTQSNRHKPWALAMQRNYEFEDRFSQDPAAAARFGIYTVVIWVLTFGVFAVLSFTIGFAWSWIALVLGLAIFMFTLARMLFPAEPRKR
jgi:MFS family permease